MSLQDRFWSKVKKTPSCWLWTGSTRLGYGRVKQGGKLLSAHRVSWELTQGQVPGGLCVLHRCDVRNCVNPRHLFLGTEVDNRRDCIRKGRAVFRKGATHPSTKLTPKTAAQIRVDYRMGYYQVEIARKFNLSQTHVSRVIRGESWT